jgi:hypothetical protein
VSTNGAVILPPTREGRSLSALPVTSLRAALPFLRRPYTAEAVRWKVQVAWPKDNPTAGQVVAYIDARLVIERLNLVVAELWAPAITHLGSELYRCDLTIDGVTRSDVGQGKGKAGWSDSLKRSAVMFGVGVSVYALPAVRMRAGSREDQLRCAGPTASARCASTRRSSNG